MSPQTPLIVHTSSDTARTAAAFAPPAFGVEPPGVVLSPKQHQAISLIMQGRSIREILAEVDIDRSTLWRWQNCNPNFVAALNRWRGQVHGELRDRVLCIGEDAATTVADAVKEGDARTSLSVLEKIGALKPGRKNPVDPYEIFGRGIDDTNGRRSSSELFARVRLDMTPDQECRAPRLLALGVVIENDRLGQNSSSELREIAGLLSERALCDESDEAAGESFDVPGPGLQKPQATRREKSFGRSSTIHLQARVIGCATRRPGGSPAGTFRVR